MSVTYLKRVCSYWEPASGPVGSPSAWPVDGREVGMVSGDERSMVARELRERSDTYTFTLGCALARVLGAMPESCDSMADCIRCQQAVLSRLADLIESSCDREAVLTVARELDVSSDTPVGYVTLSTHVLWDWHDRICEACGVAEQGAIR